MARITLIVYKTKERSFKRKGAAKDFEWYTLLGNYPVIFKAIND